MKYLTWILLGLAWLGCRLEKPAAELPAMAVATSVKEVLPAPVDTVAPVPARPLLPDYDTLQWTDVAYLDSTILIDMKYATEDNFVKEKMYDCSRCFLRPAVAQAVVRVHQDLRAEGYGLMLLDCFRPRPIQWKLWNKVPDRRFVADPRKGSMHNRGGAIDLTLTDAQGRELDMGTPFDYFGPEAYPSYTRLPKDVLERRRMLTAAMAARGFKGIKTEWWHFAYRKANYELSDMLWACYE